MEVKCLELRDAATFIPVICIRPVPDNEAQRYLLCRDGYTGGASESCIIMIDAQCRGASHDPYSWWGRTKRIAHLFIARHWHELLDGDVIDIEFILGYSQTKKVSERDVELFRRTVSDNIGPARVIIANCSYALRRTLSAGERRDLLKDNTGWSNELISAIVDEIDNPQSSLDVSGVTDGGTGSA